MIRAISLALLGAASFAAVYFAMAPDADETVAPQSTEAVASAGREAQVPSAPKLEPETVAAIRNVTPENFTAAPPVSGPLVRVEPPKPENPAQPARRERLFNPVVVSAGAIKVGDDEIRLAGIAVTEPDKSCGEGASAWPCGRLARAALRSFIRGRAIECEIPAGADEVPSPARCLVAYDDDAKAARDEKLGLFAESRPDAQLAARR
jgi:endonuclease YncB( thermonuclease family)